MDDGAEEILFECHPFERVLEGFTVLGSIPQVVPSQVELFVVDRAVLALPVDAFFIRFARGDPLELNGIVNEAIEIQDGEIRFQPVIRQRIRPAQLPPIARICDQGEEGVRGLSRLECQVIEADFAHTLHVEQDIHHLFG